MKVSANHTVRLDYELKIKGGEVLESSAQTGPLQYVHGQGKFLAGLERKIEGCTVGDEKKGELPPAEAFGDESVLPIREIPRREFPESEKLTVGRIFEAKTAGPDMVRFKIVELEDKLVKVRFLHPLADKTLEYRVKILSIDPPRGRGSVLVPPPPAQAFGIESAAIEILPEDDDGK